MQDKIMDGIKNSLKSGDKVRAGVLRMVLADLKYARVAGDSQKDLSDEEELGVVGKYLKKLEKALPDYEGTPKKDEILAEMAIVQEFLPKKASAAEIEAKVDEVIKATAEKNFGKIMRAVVDSLGRRQANKRNRKEKTWLIAKITKSIPMWTTWGFFFCHS